MILKSVIKDFNLLLKNTSPINVLSTRWTSQDKSDKQYFGQPTPFQQTKRQCILCQHGVQLDYKNPRLLSQFISPLNGNIYDKHITGLCELQQTLLEREIKRSRLAGMMPIFFKAPEYNRDPRLFDPDRPQRPNPY